MMEELWYALKTNRNAEFIVARSLSYKGYEHFLPTYRQKRYWSDRIKILELPLFAGYLFCRFDVTRRLPVLTVPGVQSIVSIAKVPHPVDPQEIDAIRRVVNSRVLYEPHPYLSVGQLVRVRDGALAGLRGYVIQIKNRHRLILSIELLMRSVSVEIDRGLIEPV
jgi:transcription antitermination factor NusG